MKQCAVDDTVVVIAKAPVPGRVKTRLCPPLQPSEAAQLAAASLRDTLRAVAAVPRVRRVIALDGTVGAWLPPGFEVVAQPTGGLDVRLASAFAGSTGRTVLVGMDTPQVTTADLTEALTALHHSDAVFGPSLDGGFWLLGLARPDPRALLDVAMSTPTTGLEQQRRLDELGLTTALMPTMQDFDYFEDAAAVAKAAPETLFASAFRNLDASHAPLPSTR